MNEERRTPLELGVLLHYYCSSEQFKPNSVVAVDVSDRYCQLEMMTDRGDGTYKVTDMGKAWIERLLSTPLPTKAAVIYSEDGNHETIWVDYSGDKS